jgi:hypothetical protein
VKTIMTETRGRVCHWVLMAGVLCAIAGCGRGDTDRCAISGEVTLDGRPVDGGNIQIDPLEAKQPSASGALVQAGRYSIPRQTGLVPGKYRVHIYWAEKVNTGIVPTITGDVGHNVNVTPPRELIPAKYNTESELTIEVRQNDANRFDFALTTEARANGS